MSLVFSSLNQEEKINKVTDEFGTKVSEHNKISLVTSLFCGNYPIYIYFSISNY